MGVVLLLAACGGDDSGGLPPTTSFDPEAPSTTTNGSTPPTVPATTPKPWAVSNDAIGYVLDNGLILWVEPPIGKIVAGDGDCQALTGDSADFYARYNKRTIPGFEGVICYPEQEP